MKPFFPLIPLALILSLLAVSLPGLGAEIQGSLAGRVSSLDGVAAADATIRLPELGLKTAAGPRGEFRLDAVPPGDHLLTATSLRYGTATQTVTVKAGSTTEIEVKLGRLFRDELVVTASPEANRRSEVYQPVAVLGGDELSARLQPSLGQTIAREPGVSSTYFGPAVGRPIIRGLGGDRVRVLENGTDSGDLSAVAPDHEVGADASLAEKIEVLRGPATLLYGSSAGGGVVNVIDSRIPEELPAAQASGTAQARTASVSGEAEGDLALDGRLGPRVAWHAGATRRKTGDYSIPGFSSVAAEREPGDRPGVLQNSAVETTSGMVGASWIGDSGFLGAAVSRSEGVYGLPGKLEETSSETGGSAAPEIDFEQNRLDLRGELRRTEGLIRRVRLLFSANDYQHVEAEGSTFGTLNTQKSWEGRVEALHGELGPFHGSWGLQLHRRDSASIGEEAFVPRSRTESRAAFALEEIETGDRKWQAGLRYEEQQIGGASAAAPERSYSGLSGSLGYIWTPGETYTVAVSLARAVKFPNAEELYSFGGHLATRAFEIGDPNLGEEVNLGLDLSLRKRLGRLTGELNLFANRFSGFIFQKYTAEQRDGLPVLRYTQGDADFRGGEARLAIELVKGSAGLLALDLGFDTVRARLRTGEPLPRIPPRKYGTGLRYRRDRLWAEAAVWKTERPERLAPLETPTAGYTLVDAVVGYRILSGWAVHDVLLRGTNLGNAEVRLHTSFLKDLAPQPGRDLNLSYRISF